MSSVPTPDMSSDFYAGVLEPQPINPPRVVPMAPPRSVHSSIDDPFASPLAKVTNFRLCEIKAFFTARNEVAAR